MSLFKVKYYNEAVFPFNKREDFEKALKTIADNEDEAMQKIYVDQGFGDYI